MKNHIYIIFLLLVVSTISNTEASCERPDIDGTIDLPFGYQYGFIIDNLDTSCIINWNFSTNPQCLLFVAAMTDEEADNWFNFNAPGGVILMNGTATSGEGSFSPTSDESLWFVFDIVDPVINGTALTYLLSFGSKTAASSFAQGELVAIILPSSYISILVITKWVSAKMKKREK